MDEAIGAGLAARRVLRGWVIVAFTAVLAGLPVTGVGTPLIARADTIYYSATPNK